MTSFAAGPASAASPEVVPGLSGAEGRWLFDGRPLAELAGTIETPAFLFSGRRIEASYRVLAEGLASDGPAPVLRYCAKTNYEAAILARLAACGRSGAGRRSSWTSLGASLSRAG